MALCSQDKERTNKELGIPRAAHMVYKHHGTGTQTTWDLLKMPLRTQILTLRGEAKRAVLSCPDSDSGQSLTLQLHKDMMYSNSLNLGASHTSSHRLAAVLLGLQQTPNPSLHGAGGAGRVSCSQLSARGSKDTSCPRSSSLCTSKAQH